MTYDAAAHRRRLEAQTKVQLAQAVSAHPQFVYSEHPPIRWRKDELVQWLLVADKPRPMPTGVPEQQKGLIMRTIRTVAAQRRVGRD